MAARQTVAREAHAEWSGWGDRSGGRSERDKRDERGGFDVLLDVSDDLKNERREPESEEDAIGRTERVHPLVLSGVGRVRECSAAGVEGVDRECREEDPQGLEGPRDEEADRIHLDLVEPHVLLHDGDPAWREGVAPGAWRASDDRGSRCDVAMTRPTSRPPRAAAGGVLPPATSFRSLEPLQSSSTNRLKRKVPRRSAQRRTQVEAARATCDRAAFVETSVYTVPVTKPTVPIRS